MGDTLFFSLCLTAGDALDGKINLIITKSVSRFARNTVDSLTTIRKLKENNIECYFEKENIWTFDTKGEFLISLMSSLAQEESRSISENCTWGMRKRFSDGKVTIPFGRFLGYENDGEGNLAINEEEAVTVRKIYQLFLEGLTPYTISKQLTAEGIPTPTGKENWHQSTVRSILKNEKYKGDALLQKRYTTDFLTKKTKINNGEVPQYYVENSHEGIVSHEVFAAVQTEFETRKQRRGRYSGGDMLVSKIKCGECGYFYGSKVWHSTDKYRKVIYQCGHKYKDESRCTTPHFTENEIKEFFIKAVNQLISEKDEVLSDLELMRSEIFDSTELKKERGKAKRELAALADMMQNCINENARIAQNQEEYNKKYNSLFESYEKARARFDELERKISDNTQRNEMLGDFIKTLKEQDGVVSEFDEVLWGSLLECVTVYKKDDVRFVFKDGTEIRV